MAEPIYRERITQPVGQGADVIGGNRKEDVRLIKQLLFIGLKRASMLDAAFKTALTSQMTFANPGTVRAITKFQDYHFGFSNGRVDADEITFTRLCEEAWKDAGSSGPPPSGPRSIMPRNMAAAFVSQKIPEAKKNYAQKAQTFIEAVSDERNPDGTRHGWQVLQRIYEETIRGWAAGQVSQFQTPMVLVGGLHWCGVFATWVLRAFLKDLGNSTTVEWVQEKKKGDPSGIFIGGVPLPGYDNTSEISVGDICVVSKTTIHHVIVISEPVGGKFETVEGNYPYGGGENPPASKPPNWNEFRRKITKRERSASEVWYYYSPFRPNSM